MLSVKATRHNVQCSLTRTQADLECISASKGDATPSEPKSVVMLRFVKTNTATPHQTNLSFAATPPKKANKPTNSRLHLVGVSPLKERMILKMPGARFLPKAHHRPFFRRLGYLACEVECFLAVKPQQQQKSH